MITKWLSIFVYTSFLVLTGWLGGGAAPAQAQRASSDAAAAIAWVDLAELPPEASETLRLIKAGGPFPYDKDGTRFGNRERVLPQRPPDHYTEYTVRTPGERTRGARRIVAGGEPRTSGEYYYTDDHYKSFRRIREAPDRRQER